MIRTDEGGEGLFPPLQRRDIILKNIVPGFIRQKIQPKDHRLAVENPIVFSEKAVGDLFVDQDHIPFPGGEGLKIQDPFRLSLDHQIELHLGMPVKRKRGKGLYNPAVIANAGKHGGSVERLFQFHVISIGMTLHSPPPLWALS